MMVMISVSVWLVIDCGGMIVVVGCSLVLFGLVVVLIFFVVVCLVCLGCFECFGG